MKPILFKILVLNLFLQLALHAQPVYHDDFSTNSLDNYNVIRHVVWNESDSTLYLTGPGNSELYTKQSFGNNLDADSLVIVQSRNTIPKPILDQHPHWVELYWKAWDIALTKIQYGNLANGFVESYLDEGFSNRALAANYEQEYQKD